MICWTHWKNWFLFLYLFWKYTRLVCVSEALHWNLCNRLCYGISGICNNFRAFEHYNCGFLQTIFFKPVTTVSLEIFDRFIWNLIFQRICFKTTIKFIFHIVLNIIVLLYSKPFTFLRLQVYNYTTLKLYLLCSFKPRLQVHRSIANNNMSVIEQYCRDNYEME